jgi:hypothetical protein
VWILVAPDSGLAHAIVNGQAWHIPDEATWNQLIVGFANNQPTVIKATPEFYEFMKAAVTGII